MSAANRAALVQLRDQVNAQIDALLDETPAAPEAPTPPTKPRSTVADWMKMKNFAAAFGYSPKTISQWCKLGMPHIGKGHYCRIDVRAAKKWIEEGGPTRSARLMGAHAHLRSVG